MDALLVGALALVLGIAVLGVACPHLARRAGEARLRRLACSRRVLVLTYDDGPSSLTPTLLAKLARHGARATFFMLGRRAAALPEVASAVAGAGHEVGSHSQEHLNAWKSTPWRVVRDTLEGMAAVERCAGEPRLYRPPYGKLTAWSWWASRRRGARLGWWTVDSGDTRDELPDPRALAESVVTAGGGVVLLHDLARTPERDAYVLAATEELLARAAQAGLRVVSLGELSRDAT